MVLKHLLLALILLIVLSNSYGELVELTDATFEHQTQASTGMTTGSWFVLFKAEQCRHCKNVKPIFDLLAEDEQIAERGVILATMDVPSNRRTATRFDIQGFPIMLFFHRGQLYRFKGERTLEAFKQFLMQDADTMLGGPIPFPISNFDVIMHDMKTAMDDFYNASWQRGGVVGIALTVLPVMFCLLVAMLVAVCFWPASVPEHEKMN